MDKIKKFFDKKKADLKFKQAGEGKKLSASSQGTSGRGTVLGGPSRSRSSPSGGAQLAGAAALARAENKPSKEVDWSLQAIKAQAKRELEAEKNLEEIRIKLENEHLSDDSEKKPTRSFEGPPQLAVQGVYFHCPILGPEVAPYNEIKNNIRDFLYSQIGEDKGVCACLIIHTCNKSKDKTTTCIETLVKYIDNIASNPTEEKYRKIRTTNKAYQERIAPVEGTKEFLEAAGFKQEQLPFNEETHLFWVFPEEKISDLAPLEQLRDSLISAEPLKPQLDRCTQVLLPTEAAKYTELPPQFFALSAEELKKEMQQRANAVERAMMLRTKAMREREEAREMRKYRFSLIRIRFPDGLILQGTFGIFEKFCQITEFVRENLTNSWRPFFLRLSGGGKITDEDHSLMDLRLAPAVLFIFEWDTSVQDPNLDDNIYLKPETLELLQPLDQ